MWILFMKSLPTTLLTDMYNAHDTMAFQKEQGVFLSKALPYRRKEPDNPSLH